MTLCHSRAADGCRGTRSGEARAPVRANVDCLWRQVAPTASTSPLSRGLCRAHRWGHSRDQVRGLSARRFVRALEHVTILPSPGSQAGEPFGEEPPGVWGSLDGYLPWETALREPSRLVQTGSRPTSHRGGHWFDPSIAHPALARCRARAPQNRACYSSRHTAHASREGAQLGCTGSCLLTRARSSR